jgi:glycosyltransferase involved in cell wall biosynthesis
LESIYLSIVIPVFNEEMRLPKTLEQVFNFLNSQSYPAEVILVENGSTDRSFDVAQAHLDKYPQLVVLKELQRGKGLAVRRGMLAAKGTYRFMCDADFSMPTTEIPRFLPPALEGCDIAIASREAAGAVRINEPYYRHFVGRIYNWLIRILALPSLHDTQCGFKCFKGEIAEELFRNQTITGWSFDVEVLFIAKRKNYRIVEVPIHWYFNPDSKISVIRDSARMAFDLVKIRLNGAQGLYDQKV